MIVEVRGKKLSIERQGSGEPVLILAGRDDAVSPVANGEGLAAQLPSATFQVLEQCGHWRPIEQASEVNAALRGFL